MKTLSISIIGADSYFGQYLLRTLQQHQQQLGVQFDFHLTSRRQTLISRTAQPHVHWHFLDLANPVTWQLPTTDVAFVFAALTGIADCERQPALATRLNLDAPEQLIQKMISKGTFCVLPSTNQVFDCTSAHILFDANYAPCSFYGELKAQLEQRLLALQSPKIAIVRPGKVIGPKFALFTRWLSQLKQGEVVSAFTDHRCAPVALQSLTELFMRIAITQISGIYQLSGEQDVSYAQLLRQITKLFGFSADNIAECRAASQGVKPTAYGSLTPHFPDLLASAGQEFLLAHGTPPWQQGDSLATVIHHALQEEVT